MKIGHREIRQGHFCSRASGPFRDSWELFFFWPNLLLKACIKTGSCFFPIYQHYRNMSTFTFFHYTGLNEDISAHYILLHVDKCFVFAEISLSAFLICCSFTCWSRLQVTDIASVRVCAGLHDTISLLQPCSLGSRNLSHCHVHQL